MYKKQSTQGVLVPIRVINMIIKKRGKFSYKESKNKSVPPCRG